MTPPIIVFCDDLYAFHSVAEAHAYLEWQDVYAREHDAYDAHGRLLHVGVVQMKGGAPSVVIHAVEGEPSHSDRLYDQLITYLERRKELAGHLRGASLQDLIQKI